MNTVRQILHIVLHSLPALRPRRLCRNSVHGSTSSPRTVGGTLKINHLAVRPELVEGPAANYDIVSRRGGKGWGGCIFLNALFSALILLPTVIVISPSHASSRSLLIFAGSASKPPLEEASGNFTRETGNEIRITFGGSGFVLSQMKLARKGEIYFPGSSDFMEKAKRERLVFPETEKVVAYLIPAINVQGGNPKNIRGLKDLLKPGVRLGIADPETVCVGTYAVEVIEKNLSFQERERFRKNLVTTVESCERTANLISLKAVDAVIGWEVFQRWDPKRIETVLLKPGEVPRIGYIPAAVSAFAAERVLAEDFLRFLVSPKVQSVFQRHGYLTAAEEARKYTLPETPVGGEYFLPGAWRRRGK